MKAFLFPWRVASTNCTSLALTGSESLIEFFTFKEYDSRTGESVTIFFSVFEDSRQKEFRDSFVERPYETLQAS